MSIFDRDRLKERDNFDYISTVIKTYEHFGKDSSGLIYKLDGKTFNVVIDEVFSDADYEENEKSNIFLLVIPESDKDISIIREKIYINLWNATTDTLAELESILEKWMRREKIEKMLTTLYDMDMDEKMRVVVNEFESKLRLMLF